MVEQTSSVVMHQVSQDSFKENISHLNVDLHDYMLPEE